VLTHDQHRKLVADLTNPADRRVSATWETVLLHALSRIAAIEHEKVLPNGRKPDFALRYVHDQEPFTIVGDITSVSDKGLDENNPIADVVNEIRRVAGKYGIEANHLYTRAEGQKEGKWRDSRMVLLIPQRQRIPSFVKTYVEPFLRSICKDPVAPHEQTFLQEGAKFSVRYDPKQRYPGYGHPPYDAAYSRRKHPITVALREKRKQLSGAPADAIRLVFLCDGGCRAITASAISADTFTAGDVVQAALRQTSSIDVVVLLSIQRRDPFDLRIANFVLQAQVAWSERSPRLTRTAIAAILDLFKKTVPVFPTPVLDGANAAIRSQIAGYSLGFHGGFEMTAQRIRISSRQVHELLAGEVTYEEFASSLGWARKRNPFAKALNDGRMIGAVGVTSGGDADDDWLEFLFGDPDPAIARLK
jgi:hypothetical protein